MNAFLADLVIPKLDCQLFGDANAPQPMSEVIEKVMFAVNDENAAWHLAKFAPYFRGYTTEGQYKLLNDLWRFVRFEIPYLEDPSNQQIVKAPACCWQYRNIGADCKSKTVFIYWTGRLIGLPVSINFWKYDEWRGHVFPSVWLDGKEIRIDAVNEYFDNWNEYKVTDKETKIPNVFKPIFNAI